MKGRGQLKPEWPTLLPDAADSGVTAEAGGQGAPSNQKAFKVPGQDPPSTFGVGRVLIRVPLPQIPSVRWGGLGINSGHVLPPSQPPLGEGSRY